ncbi:MAG: hypothetical protein QE277_00215 [Flectobacillus sp.]|nr:hypothetical protein [Flectobacillus sp.]
MNNLVELMVRSATNWTDDVNNGVTNPEDILKNFMQMSYLDYCLIINPRMYETFVYDNNENIEILRRKLDRRDDIEQKIVLIKAEKEKIIKYLESDEISETIAMINKPLTIFFELMKRKYEQVQNDPDIRDSFNDNEGKELNIFIENADKFLKVKNVEEIGLPKILANQPQLLNLSSPDEILKELSEQKLDDLTQFIPISFSELEEIKQIDNEKILDETFKLLYIHSQEQYFEMLRVEEKRIKEDYSLIDTEETIDTNEGTSNVPLEDDKSDLGNTITIDLPNFPRAKNRKNGDNLTCLSREATAVLIDTLREAKAFLDEEFQSNINIAKAVQVLTGFSYNRLRTDLTAISSKKELLATQEILQKSIHLINKRLAKK